MASSDLINVDITLADVHALMQRNPLAAEQLKGIALMRLMAKQEEALAKAREELAQLNGQDAKAEVPIA